MVDCDTSLTDELTFRIYLPHAGRVEVVGSFTEWEGHPMPMHRGAGEEAGWWMCRCALPAGDHTFAYLVDGQYWMPDYAASGVHRNEHGQWTSDLSVGPGRNGRAPAPVQHGR